MRGNRPLIIVEVEGGVAEVRTMGQVDVTVVVIDWDNLKSLENPDPQIRDLVGEIVMSGDFNHPMTRGVIVDLVAYANAHRAKNDGPF